MGRPKRDGPTPGTCIRFTPEDRRKIEAIRLRLGLRTWASVVRLSVERLYYADQAVPESPDPAIVADQPASQTGA